MLPDRAPGDTENRNLVLEPLMLFPRLHEGAGSPRRKPSGMTERPRRPPQAGPLCTRSARSRAALECLAAWRLRTTQKDGAGLARRRANPGGAIPSRPRRSEAPVGMEPQLEVQAEAALGQIGEGLLREALAAGGWLAAGEDRDPCGTRPSG
jgi:hypothetical protein